MNKLIKAKRVYDQKKFQIPSDLMPNGMTLKAGRELMESKGQMRGTDAEQLTELSGRSCYDSLGNGRNSTDYHVHIQEVGHLSVCEHFNFTVGFAFADAATVRNLLMTLANRPGIWVSPTPQEIRVTLNLRSALEWDKFDNSFSSLALVSSAIQQAAHQLAPVIVPKGKGPALRWRIVPAKELLCEQEMWVSLFLAGSRGFSHEMVRHGDRTAISQRSTRYVDETDSPWIEHPVITAYKEDKGASYKDEPLFRLSIPDASKAMNYSSYVGLDVYAPTVEKLQAWLQSKGVDKFTARKQARGAARGFLGNALSTEMIFSASVAQWKTILKQRLHPAADAEIREVAYKALAELQSSQWGSHFKEFSTTDSPDGIGYVLA